MGRHAAESPPDEPQIETRVVRTRREPQQVVLGPMTPVRPMTLPQLLSMPVDVIDQDELEATALLVKGPPPVGAFGRDEVPLVSRRSVRAQRRYDRAVVVASTSAIVLSSVLAVAVSGLVVAFLLHELGLT